MATVDIARVYDAGALPSRHRVLVDRLWPRGVTKHDAPFDTWLKDVAPSTTLRTWYRHDPDRFAEFAQRYRCELVESPAREALTQLHELARTSHVVLVTATKDVDHSAAAVLRDVLASASSQPLIRPDRSGGDPAGSSNHSIRG